VKNLKIVIAFFLTYHFGTSQITIDSVFIVDSVHQIFKHTKPAYKYQNELNQGTSTFLSSITSAQIQQSSPGGLATLLHRGMGSRHLPVMWEGVNIQSMVNGSFDLSLIPLQLYSGTKFYTFGAPTLTGSNSLAGAMDITDIQEHQKSYVGFHLSTLSNLDMMTKLVHTGKKYSGSFGGELSFHQNRYSYIANNIRENRVGTNQNKYNLIHKSNYYISKNQMLGIDIWHQGSDREIPVSTSSGYISQQQIDQNTRIKSYHTILIGDIKFNSWFAWMDENIHFKTPSVDSKANVSVINAGTEFNNQSGYAIKLTYRKDIVDANFFNGIKSRTQLSISSSKTFEIKKSTISVSARQDFTDGTWMPFSFTGSINHKKLSVQLSRNFNLPGFNDLYWPVSGRDDLKTELSHQGELKYNFNVLGLKILTLMYGNHVKDWIQWIPISNGLWTPSNQKTVLSKGFESHLSKEWNHAEIKVKAELQYHFNRTTALDHYFENDLIGKQLIYVPQHTLTSGFLIGKNRQAISGSLRFTGKRYYTPDNQYHLSPYYTVDIYYRYKLWDKVELNISIQNLTNHQYNIVRFFPMPGITGSFLFKYYIKS
jgi:vitamin B12 transporter